MKKIWYLVFIVSSILIIIFIYNMSNYYYSYKKELEFKNKISKYKFNELLEINPDIVGFIEVDNTEVSYPIVKSNDNSYYLNHTYTKEKSEIGSIFLDYRNNLDNLSFNNIIYGHGRIDNTMFGSLNNLLNKKILNSKDSHYIKISTEKKIMIFKIFSVYTIPKESYYIKTYFSSNKYFKEFLETIMKRSIYNFKVNLNTNDKILTLSTCKDNFGKRVVVHAKLIKE